MRNLTEREAEAIHEMILQYGETDLIAEYEDAIKFRAKARYGRYFQTLEWRGTPINDTLYQELIKQFGLENLQEYHFFKHWLYYQHPDNSEVPKSGPCVEVRSLAHALPKSIREGYFPADPQVRAQKAGIDYEQFQQELKAAYKGTVGVPGASDFGILLDVGNNETWQQYDAVLCLGMVVPLYDKATLDAQHANLHPSMYPHIRARQGQQVVDMGLDPQSVMLITLDYHSLAVRYLAQFLAFPGAEYYLSAEEKP